jgi:uncharacterized protein YjeT (DUF2065 family)
MAGDLLVALGLVLVIEGVLYALAPQAMRRALDLLLRQPEQTVRGAGIAVALLGLAVVVLARR